MMSSPLFVSILAVNLAFSFHAYGAEKDKAREVDKLIEKPIESASIQTLTSIYADCINNSLGAAASEEREFINHKDLMNSCMDERENLEKLSSKSIVDFIDTLAIEQFNKYPDTRNLYTDR